MVNFEVLQGPMCLVHLFKLHLVKSLMIMGQGDYRNARDIWFIWGHPSFLQV